MVIKYKIRDSDWLTFRLIIVNFNHVFIQQAPDLYTVSTILCKPQHSWQYAFLDLFVKDFSFFEI